MKQATFCASCKKLIGRYKSYAVEIEETPVVQGMRMPTIKYKARVCPDCAWLAGYKISKQRLSERVKGHWIKEQTLDK